VDPSELPRAWTTVDVLAEQIGEAEYRVAPDQGPSPMNPASTVLPSSWERGMQAASAELRSGARVTLGDKHLDAKLFPHLHPYGSGSLRSEADPQECKTSLRVGCYLSSTRSDAPQCGRSGMLERLIKNDLYFKEQNEEAGPGSGRRADAGLPDSIQGAPANPDNYAELFGRVEPRHIPESGAWLVAHARRSSWPFPMSTNSAS